MISDGDVMLEKHAEQYILDRALNALNKETGLVGEVGHIGLNVYRPKWEPIDRGWDAEIKIATPNLEHKVLYFVEIKKQLRKEAIGPLIFKFTEGAGRELLVTDYVNPLMAKRLRENDIQFIDTCGNAYINAAPLLYIYVKGNKKGTYKGKRVVGPRAFKMAGLRVVYTLLCHPGFEKATFREIGMVANVALGTVDAVMKNLMELGFLIEKGKLGRKLVNKEKILERWITAFPEVLRPKIIVGKFTARDKYWWEKAQLPDGFFWGGEVAAAKITGYLKPEIITIYAHHNPERLLLEFKLRKDPEGEIEILEIFWGGETEIQKEFWRQWEEYEKIVNPLLIYADLLATGDARNIETANMVYKNELDRFIREA